MTIGLFSSGNLGFQVFKSLVKEYSLVFVFTDKKSQDIIDLCEVEEVPVFVGNPRNEKGIDFINKYNFDVLVSVNYLFLIEKRMFERAKEIAFNVHGSLLPKYRGRTPHVWAIINNEEKTGITAHCIDEGCDTGDIIEQIEIDIESDDTGYDILKKFERNYIPLVKRVLTRIENKKVELRRQSESEATFFGKRTPEDGRICWDWHKERIYNWVRAQADPYPGAFTYYLNHKLIIDKIDYSNNGFNANDPNGLVLSSNPLIVKTPNGAVEIKSYRESSIISVEKGTTLK